MERSCEIKFGEKDIKSIDTNELRKYESYLTQHTHLFNETIEQNIKLAKKIAQKVAQAGGRAYYVGGCVRDQMLGIENKDIDIEVHRLTPEQLKELLSDMGTLLSYGSSFGVFSLAGSELDIAMPRRERAIGPVLAPSDPALPASASAFMHSNSASSMG